MNASGHKHKIYNTKDEVVVIQRTPWNFPKILGRAWTPRRGFKNVKDQMKALLS